jgi:hypothetical protein
MTIPLSSPFTDGTAVDKAQLDQVVASINALPRGSIGSTQNSSSPVTLGDTANHAGPAAYTFIVAAGETRKIRIEVSSTFSLASGTDGFYATQVAYNTGSTANIATATLAGLAGGCYTGVAGTTGRPTATVAVVVVLGAGTYTAFAMVTRNVGTATDQCVNSRVAVADMGGA